MNTSPQQKHGRILITGATGFIGQYLYPLLAKGHFDVVALTRWKKDRWGKFPTTQASLSDGPAIRRMANRIRPETIVHMAAKIPTRKFSEDNNFQLHLDQNLINSLNLVRASTKTLRHFIYLSTIDVYGPTLHLPINEDHPTRPVGPYGVTKLSAELCLRSFCALHGISLTILRLSQVYGYGEQAVKIIPTYIRHAVRGTTATLIGRGEDRRDFLYVKDAANAVRLAIMHPVDGTFNIGSGQSHSIRQAIEEIKKLADHQLKVSKKARPGEPTFQRLSIKRAQAAFGYQPRYSLRTGLRETFINTARAENPPFFIDVDGPILETSRRHYEVYQSIMNAIGRRALSRTRYWQLKRRGLSDEKIAGPLVKFLQKRYYHLKLGRIEQPRMLKLDRLQPGAAQSLHLLSNKHKIIFISLRQHPDRLLFQLDRLGARQYADCIHVTPGGQSPTKVKAGLIRSCEKFYPRAIIVGDTEVDIAAAKSLHLQSIAVTHGIRSKKFLERTHPAVLVTSLAELPKKIKSLF